MIEASLIFNLCDNARGQSTNEQSDRVDMGRTLNKADADIIDTILLGELHHVAIMVCNQITTQLNLRHVDAFTAAQRAISKRTDMDVPIDDQSDDECKRSVISV